ncbi:MAG: DUF3090 family protein [Nitriliruptor sp.]|nr:MAG: DUF3090 family protein [Nitriliruptor sp.]
MMDVELTAPHHVTVGFTGVPGARTFFLQAEDDVQRVGFLLEKEQARGIGELLGQLLARLGDGGASDWDRAAMELRAPVEGRWRVGELSLGFDPEQDRFLLELTELVADEGGPEPREGRVWLDRDQARRLASHALEVVGQGRPTCELCGRPTEPDGAHVCPATNGHGKLSR